MLQYLQYIKNPIMMIEYRYIAINFQIALREQSSAEDCSLPMCVSLL